MSILIVGDLHFKPGNVRQTTIIQQDIMEIINKQEILMVILLGDTLDNHEKINMECYNRACDMFDMIISTGIPLFVIIGNHDRANNKVYMTNRHPFRGYCNISGIKIVDKCYLHQFTVTQNDGNIANLKFCFVPFVPDGMYLQALSDCNINPNEVSIFFSHSEFHGCKINKLSKSKCDIWPVEYPLNISGHIHDEEVVQDNLIYVGTPFQHTYSDSIDKGLFIMNLRNGEYKLEKLKTNVPRKVTWQVHYTQLQNITLNPDLDIKLEIFGPTQCVKELMKRPDMIEKFGSVVKRYKDETVKDSSKDLITVPASDNQQFSQIFLNEISKDETMNFIYSHLFR